jgi:hypothetical protein
LHIEKLNYEKGIYEMGDHVGEKALNLNLPPKLRLAKKNPPTIFPNRLLKNA